MRGGEAMPVSFKGAHFPQDIILMGVRWYVAYPLSYRHVEELMEERGVLLDHATIQRWVVKYSAQLEEAFHRRQRPVGRRWRMDETYIRVKGEGSVANFAQGAVQGQWPPSVWGLCCEGVELFGHREALVSCLNHQLPFLEHVHELDPRQRRLCGLERFEPQHGTRHPFDRSMVLFHDIIQIFHLPDDDVGAVLLIVALDGRFIRPASINGDRLGDPVTVDRLRQKA
jgi:hypothetical protein